MSKLTTVSICLCLFLVVSFLFDYVSFAQHSNFSSLESNPLYNMFGDFSFLIIKLEINGILILLFYFTWKYNNVTRMKKFAVTYLVLLMTVFQFIGFYSNITAKQAVLQDIQEKYGEDIYPTLESIPQEIIETYSLEKAVRVKEYLSLVFIAMFLPILITMASFKLWELMYFTDGGDK